MPHFREIKAPEVNPLTYEDEGSEHPEYSTRVRADQDDPGASTPLPSEVDLSGLSAEEQQKLKNRLYMRRFRERKKTVITHRPDPSTKRAVIPEDSRSKDNLIRHLQQVVAFLEKEVQQQSKLIERLSDLCVSLIDDTLEFNAQDDMRAAILASRRNPNHPPNPRGIINEVNMARRAQAQEQGAADVREVKEAERVVRRISRVAKKVAELEARYEFITGFKLAREPGE